MLNYLQLGNEQSENTLVFVHGSGCNHNIFGEVYKYLTDYNCIMVDLNGHGYSKGKCSPTVEGYIDNVSDFIKNSDVTKNKTNITIIGYSMGGAIVLGVALKKLPNVKKVVVLSGASQFYKLKDTELLKGVHKTNTVDEDCAAKYLINEATPLTNKYMESLEQDQNILINDLKACEKFNISNEIKNIDIPVKSIVARDEILVLKEYADFTNSQIKNSILSVFEHGKHFLLVIKGKEVAKEISSFVCD